MYDVCVDNLVQLVADVFVDNGINNGEILYVSAALLWRAAKKADALVARP
jgi:hypothetical protein